VKSQALANPEPANVIQLANRLIAEDAQHGMFVTVFYGVYNIETRLLKFINAVHTLPLLYRPSTRSCASLVQHKLSAGVFDPFSFQPSKMQLESGDILILYTDGVNEAFSPMREQFGMERLVQVILQYGDRPPQELRNLIVDTVHRFSADQLPNDEYYCVDCESMKASALTILKILREHGFTALFVGGCVRDMLMGKEPGITTLPPMPRRTRLMQIFQRTVPVGVQLGIVIVLMKGRKFEVAQFRNTTDPAN
jgi:hypothetical protein